MKILVIGSLERARSLLETADRKHHTVFHCKEDARLTRSFSPIESPDWILIDEKALPGNWLCLVQSLQAMDFYSTSAPGTSPGCGLERDRQGRMRLNCGLRGRPGRHVSSDRRDPDQGGAALCFEYQAPLRRQRN